MSDLVDVLARRFIRTPEEVERVFSEPDRFKEIGMPSSFTDGHLSGLTYRSAFGVDFVVGHPHTMPPRSVIEAGIRELLARADAT